MSESVFGRRYAASYDLFYAEKDYGSEADTIEQLLREQTIPLPCSILDLGCGTGGHALALAGRGHEVVGVDRAEAMIEIARAQAGPGGPTFEVGDLRTVDLERTFDAALMMFAVLGYQTGDDDVLAALRTARRHLREGGVLLFDVWYGPAVLHQRPAERVRVFRDRDGVVVRRSTGRVDLTSQVCDVDIDVLVVRADSTEEFGEQHRMRFFFPRELVLLLRSTGFRELAVRSFPGPGEPADETTWSVLVAAVASPAG